MRTIELAMPAAAVGSPTKVHGIAQVSRIEPGQEWQRSAEKLMFCGNELRVQRLL
jgi:hypothetical protein